MRCSTMLRGVFFITLVVVYRPIAANTWGVPPGAHGTLDFRYPDHIVSPLVPCPAEGVYPHPRDCNWYYRCYDRYGYGFYWRAYFMCEAGTVFSDLLDQCVFGSANDNCKPTYPEPTDTKPSTNIMPPYVKPTPTLPPPPPPPVCETVIDQCSSRPVCPQSSSTTLYVYQVRVCEVAETRCSDGSVTAICSGDQIYGEAMGDCVDKSSLCRGGVRPPNPPLVCEDIVDSCRDIYTCDSATPSTPSLIRRCDIYQVCMRAGEEISRSSICASGSFDAYQNVCADDNPEQYEGCDATVPQRFPIPQSPACQTNAETCEVIPVCNSGDTALVCKQFFSCDKTYARVTRQSYTQVAPACLDVEPVKCEVITESCNRGAFCPSEFSTTLFVPLSTICSVAKSVCTDGSSRDFCQPHQVFDVQENSCRAVADLCTTSIRPIASLICEDVLDECEDRSVCPNVPTIPERVRRCRLTRVCSQDGVEIIRSPMCPDGTFFDGIENRCVQDDSAPCEVPAPSPSTPLCDPHSERCFQQTVCNSGTVALMCVKVFACDINAARSIALRSSYPPAGSECLPLILPVTCADEVSVNACSSSALCPAEIVKTVFVQQVKLCPKAQRPCSDGTSEPACQSGSIYVQDVDSCLSASQECGEAPPREKTSIVCEDVLEGCEDVSICQGSPDEASTRRLCDLSRTCTRDGAVLSKSSVCPGGKFDAQMNECVPQEPGLQPCSPEVEAPTKPQCVMETEVCVTTPVCQTELTALVCKHVFSCSPALTVFSSRQEPPVAACVDIPEVLPVPVTCGDFEVKECINRAYCSNETSYATSEFVSQVKACAVAQKTCSDDSVLSACQPGEFYIPNELDCVSETEFCRVTPRQPFPIVCVDEISNCEDSYVCQTDVIQPQVIRRCDMDRVCTQDGVEVFRQSVCDGGKFDALSNQCMEGGPGAYTCNANTTTSLKPLPPLICEMVHEICEVAPVCNTELTTLVCRHRFACVGSSSPSRRSTFSSALQSTRDTSCMVIPALEPPTCEVQTSRCQYYATCPLDFMESQFVPTIKLCSRADTVCSDGSRTSLCPGGQLYDNSTGKCVIESSLCKPPDIRPNHTTICEDEFRNCEDVNVCPSDPDVAEVIRRCDYFRVCLTDGIPEHRVKICDAKYDANINRCVLNTPAGEGCSPAITAGPAPPQPTCQMITEACDEQPICNSTSVALVCRKLYYCLGTSGYYLRQTEPIPAPKCVDVPSPKPAVDPPAVLVPGDTVINDSFSVQCNFEGHIPVNEKVKSYLCRSEALCSRRAQFLGLVTVCDVYYKCIKTEKEKQLYLQPQKHKCPDGQVLQFDTQKCINLVTDTSLPCQLLGTVSDPNQGKQPETVEYPEQSFMVQTSDVLRCTYDKERPITDLVKRIQCLYDTVCDTPGKVTRQEKCPHYYECEYVTKKKDYILHTVKCPPGESYSHVRGQCYVPSTNLCP